MCWTRKHASNSKKKKKNVKLINKRLLSFEAPFLHVHMDNQAHVFPKPPFAPLQHPLHSDWMGHCHPPVLVFMGVLKGGLLPLEEIFPPYLYFYIYIFFLIVLSWFNQHEMFCKSVQCCLCEFTNDNYWKLTMYTSIFIYDYLIFLFLLKYIFFLIVEIFNIVF